MKINKTKIYSLENNLPSSLVNKTFVPAIILDEIKDRDKILKLGFSEDMKIGETLLPSIVGTTSKFNANGKEIPDKTKEKEIIYFEREWTRQEWAGKGETRNVTESVLIPRKRWQRIFITPPSSQITISKKENGLVFITTDKIKFDDLNKVDALHKINLMLDINHSNCEILDENQIPIVKNLQQVNWKILPAGKMPWSELYKHLKPVLDLQKKKTVRPIIYARFKAIADLGSDFNVVGTNGYSGYVIFGFKKKNIYVFESAQYGNAMYVFENNWEEISKKTKAEILNAKLHLERITHNGERNNVVEKVKNLLKRK